MRHRFDLHVHSFFSADAADSPEDLIASAKARGLSGIAITDHDTCDAHKYMVDNGLENPDGMAVDGFLVIPGVEVSTAEGHLLCLGTTLPRMRGEPAAKVIAAVRERGGVVIPAHPFDRWRSGIKPEVMDTLDIEVVEVFNAAVSSRSYNEQAEEYARNRRLAMTAASDAHHASAVGVSCTAFEMEELTVPVLLGAVCAGGIPEGRYLTFREAMKKHFGNWFRKANRRLPEVS